MILILFKTKLVFLLTLYRPDAAGGTRRLSLCYL